jgi:hypothetical protein
MWRLINGDQVGSLVVVVIDLGIVTEPPKLYGPHTPVTVSKISDGYACNPGHEKPNSRNRTELPENRTELPKPIGFGS